jgi:hypothetical protein
VPRAVRRLEAGSALVAATALIDLGPGRSFR